MLNLSFMFSGKPAPVVGDRKVPGYAMGNGGRKITEQQVQAIRQSAARKERIRELLKRQPLSAQTIADRLSYSESNTRKLLREMHEAGDVRLSLSSRGVTLFGINARVEGPRALDVAIHNLRLDRRSKAH